jgi:pyridoxal 5'-phosphate synthase pdxT subunit
MITPPVIGVLAVQGDVREHAESLKACGAHVRPVRRPEDLAGLDGIVLPGGESTAISRLLVIQELFEPLKAAIRTGLPAYGSCAGMILLSRQILDGRPDQQSLDGIDMTVRRNAFGSQVDSFEVDLALPVVGPESFHAVFIRAPWVERVGQGVEVLAHAPAGDSEAADSPGRIVAVRHGACLATSFHPELTGDTRIHQYFLDMVRQA